MAKLLNRKQLVHHIRQMLFDTNQFVYLICPYINLNKDEYLIKAFKVANERGVPVHLIYSKGFDKNQGHEKLKQFPMIEISYIAELHMKVYISEKSAIVSSLNLHDFSIKNNLECGIFIDKNEDLWREVYDMIKKDIYKNRFIVKKIEKVLKQELA